jgi:hypothetical protein
MTPEERKALYEMKGQINAFFTNHLPHMVADIRLTQRVMIAGALVAATLLGERVYTLFF